jgi:hypothetical protein
VRCWGFERWISHALYSNCFWLSVRVVRCCSHLARPCVAFHRLVGKTCGTLINRNRDARPELRDMVGVVTSTGIRIYDQSHIFWPESVIRLESCLLTGVGYTTRVVFSNRSRAYDQSHIIQLESSIRSELHLPIGVVKYLHYKHG